MQSMPISTLTRRTGHVGPRLSLCVALLFGCSSGNKPAADGSASAGGKLETLELRYQGSNSTVLYHELAEDLGFLAPLKLKWIGNTISGPQDIQTVVTGDTDIGGAFNGAIIKLIAAKAPIRAVQGYYGVDDQTWSGFFVRADSPIQHPRDLIGKKISMNTLGAHAELMLREYLGRGGLSPEEIKQVTLVVVPPINGEQALRLGQVDLASLGGIFRQKALQRGGLRRLFSDHELYGSFTAGSLVVTHKALRERPNALRKFVEGTGRAIEWARSQPREVVQKRMADIIRKRSRGEDPSLVQYWLSPGIAGNGGRIADREFQMWIDWLIKDGALKPGQIKLSDLFSNELNASAAAEHASLSR
jgi:ABC-type nitrate/sulfonate/bicarbonate transport system substrate-binding protein